MIEIVMPKLGLTMDEGTIKQWLKKEGDRIEAGEEILEVEGDKTSSMVEAPGSGILGKILFPNDGDVVPVTKPVAYILEEGESFTEAPASPAIEEVPEEDISQQDAQQDVAGEMVEIVMPKLGLTMDEGTIKGWFKKEGDSVEEGEEILEVEGDKTSSAVEAPASGTLYKILAQDGDVVPIIQPIAYILPKGAKAPVKNNVPSGKTESGRRKISPLARKYALENGIDLDQIAGDETGVVHIKQVMEQKDKVPKVKVTPMAKAIAAENNVDLSKIDIPEGGRIYKAQVEHKDEILAVEPLLPETDGDIEVPFRGMTKTIAKRMTQSKQQVPHYYLTISCDMTNANEVIRNVGYKVSFHDYLARVLAVALQEHSEINAHVYEDKLILKKDINVGVAVAVDSGLIVPVIRNVQNKSLSQIAGESQALIRKAREGNLRPDDYQGGTITISNLGMFGIEEFSAIINQPEAAILAVGRTTETPVVENGEVVIRPICKMTASFDHRAINGAVGAKFLKRVKELVENPIKLI